MLYSFAKILMTAGLRFFYRHIYITGFENIPLKGPVVLIANHNSSLMDAALLGILLKRQAYFFARGDVFINPAIQKILWWLHMMPVHSYEGGRSTLHLNNGSFSTGRQILLKGGVIVFFPESSSHTEHRLLPFRKGVFRLAFDAAAAGNFLVDVPIVPVGITYDHPVNCRTSVQVHAGKPLWLSDYKDEYSQNAPAAVLHTCKDAYGAMQQLVLHVEDISRLQTANQHLIIARNDRPAITSSWKIASAKKLKFEQAACTGIDKAFQQLFDQEKEKSGSYFQILAGLGLEDKTVNRDSFSSWKTGLLWVGLPFYLIGLLLNGLPVQAARVMADKKVTREDFYSWVFTAGYSVGYFLWLTILISTACLFSRQYAVVLLGLMPATGLFAYLYKGWLHTYRQQKNWNMLSPATKKTLTAMRASCKIPAQRMEGLPMAEC